MLSEIQPFLKPDTILKVQEGYLEDSIHTPSEGLKANAYYYNNPEWAEEYLKYVHRSETFKNRWEAAMGGVENNIVVDIGCGPGNLFATLDKIPKVLIGVDVSYFSLKLAGKSGYIPILADAHNLPFTAGFADIVTLNATLHHCDDMQVVLKEAARIVKPGGYIITDHDPQLSAWDFKGVAKLLWNSRLLLYRITGHGFHKTNSQQYWGLKSEVHHKPGHGVTKEFFGSTLGPLGFDVTVYAHNHNLGAEVLEGNKGRAIYKYRLGNLLSGRNPDSEKSALSLMCIAVKNND